MKWDSEFIEAKSLGNIVEFQMNGSEIHSKLSEIMLHYLNFALAFLKFTCKT